MRQGSGVSEQRSGKALLVAGVMSGTSADGVDVAVCRVSEGVDGWPRVKVVGWRSFAYAKKVRAEVLRVMEGAALTAGEISRLHWRLGEVYADAVAKTCAELGIALGRDADLSDVETVMKMRRPGGSVSRLGLVGCHGQTVYHQSGAAKFLGKDIRCTWQLGEASVLAERLRCPVVSDFRPADMAAGGQGAPLVPMADLCLFRSAKLSRVMLNLGGIGNVTALPAGCGVDGVLAFDTGPGNMVVDGCMRRLYGKGFDRGGKVGLWGQVLQGVVEAVMRDGYFSSLPPKSCGREQFGAAFVERVVDMCQAAGGGDADAVATAAAMTAASVVDAYGRFVWGHVGVWAPGSKVEFVVSGGGVKNAAVMGMLRDGLGALGVKVRLMEELGVASEAKESVAFALLAWLTWQRKAGNIVGATGARREVVLGKVSLG